MIVMGDLARRASDRSTPPACPMERFHETRSTLRGRSRLAAPRDPRGARAEAAPTASKEVTRALPLELRALRPFGVRPERRTPARDAQSWWATLWGPIDPRDILVLRELAGIVAVILVGLTVLWFLEPRWLVPSPTSPSSISP
jgi:hypothetical protein